MKLFLKQQLPFLLMFGMLTALLLGLVWLDGYRKSYLLLYGLLLSLFIVAVFMIFVYATQRNLYQALSRKHQKSVYEEIEKDLSPLSQSINELLQIQYQHYFQEVKQLRNARDEHTRFINQWIHQMKTPLAVIELMVQEDEMDKESLLEETDRMKEGLNLALTMARVESFQQDFVIQKVNLRKLAIKVVAEHKRNFIRNYVYPKITVAEELVVETDEKWLSFIVYQLLSNGIKYSSKSETTVELAATICGDNIYFTVTDQGIGIAQSDLPRVFQPFFTGNQGRNHYEATGMGLYLVNEIIHELGHRIELTSEVGKGTTATLIF